MKIKHIFFAVVVIIFIGVAAAVLFMENIVKTTVNKYGSEIIGTKVELQGFSLNPLNGTASIRDFTVANPKNYQTPYLFRLGGISIKVDMKSVLSDTIIIEDITVAYDSVNFTRITHFIFSSQIVSRAFTAPTSGSITSDIHLRTNTS